MRPRQIVRGQAERQDTGAGYFEPVIEDCDANRAARNSIVTMTKRVGECLTQSLGWIERIVYPLEQVRHNPAGDW